MERRSFLKGLAAAVAGSAVASIPVPAAAPAPVELAREYIEPGASIDIETARVKHTVEMAQRGFISQEVALDKLGLSDEMKKFYSKQLLEQAQARLVHRQLAVRPAVYSEFTGKTMEWRKYGG